MEKKRKLRIGIAFDLKDNIKMSPELPEDIYEEFDVEETILAIERVLISLDHEVVRLYSGRQFLDKILKEKIDIVFNIAEGFGTRSRESHIPSVLELLGIPFTGSDPLTLALTLDKTLTKRVVQSAKIRTPEFIEIDCLDGFPLENKFQNLRFPLIVKLSREGSSIGLRKNSKVNNVWEMESKIRELSVYKEPILIERYLPGKEITAGVIGNGEKIRFIGMMEISPRHVPVEDFVYSLEVKRNWREEVRYIVNPEIPENTKVEIEEMAISIYKLLGCRDIARIDFRLDKDFTPYFLEVNPLPGLNPEYSDLPMIARGYGLSYEKLIEEILNSALERNAFNI
ncbi:MAG: D-alanine--D-alanine ligase family protein [Candidatus Aminicenantia bacterium]